MDSLALERAKQRIADAAAGRPEPAALEAALERSRDQIEGLAAATAELETVLYSVSHDLRAPLRQLLGFSRLLLDESGPELDSSARHYAESIYQAADKMTTLVDDLVNISRIGRQDLSRREVQLTPLVEDVIGHFRLEKDGRTIDWQVEELPTVEADPGLIKIALTNLLSNAVKFTPSGGRIVVTTTYQGDSVVVAVSDTGRGIPEDLLPFIFEPFRQAEGAQRRTHTGLGLGLAIVRHVVELHGGSVHVASEGPGKGATFSVRLPVGPDVRTTLSPRRAREGGERTVSLHGIRLLLVEDDPDTREVVGALLRDAGAKVMAVSSVEAALEAIGSAPPDVLISDVGMADQDGYDLIRAVRMMTSSGGGLIPAIALSAFARESDRQDALDAGYDRHVAKPVEISVLLAAVADVVAARSR
jgi:CheY-like chemotaxis protein/two-component sensor histidine kinase